MKKYTGDKGTLDEETAKRIVKEELEKIKREQRGCFIRIPGWLARLIWRIK